MTVLAHQRRSGPSGPDAAPRASKRGQRGVTLVEAAFAVPIFFLLLLGLVDIGVAVFQTSQATSGAVDGARIGIIWPAKPDDDAVADHLDDIREAVRDRLVGQDIADSDIAISCLTDGKSEGPCSKDLDPLRTQIKVTVRWRWKPVSFIGGALPVQDIKGSSTMAIVSQPSPPTTVTPPAAP